MNFEDLNSGEGIAKFSDFFEPKQLIGQGAFGQVILATDRKSGLDCAVKVYNIYVVAPKNVCIARLYPKRRLISMRSSA